MTKILFKKYLARTGNLNIYECTILNWKRGWRLGPYIECLVQIPMGTARRLLLKWHFGKPVLFIAPGYHSRDFTKVAISWDAIQRFEELVDCNIMHEMGLELLLDN